MDGQNTKAMMRKFSFLATLLFSATWCQAAMTIQINNAPQLTPLLDTIYIVGTFNDWTENDAMFICVPNSNGWSVVIDASPSTIVEFKFTRGSWATVEGDANGQYIGNRQVSYIDGSIMNVDIEGWEDLQGIHTTTPQVKILDSNFYIPQLNRTRRIWIRLPENYSESDTGYPVSYFLDGQNAMDAATSFAGEWQIDEALDNFLAPLCTSGILVAIDNGGGQRIDEYSPWYNSTYSEGGEGAEFAAFLAETLKPYIDTHFNTLTNSSETTIIGSSLGALIATYALCTYPNQFGHGGLFSPAYWFNPEIFEYANNHPLSGSSRVYFVAGTTESDDMVPDMQNMETIIQSAGIVSPSTFLVTHADGAHSEWYWRREFPAAYEWLTQCAIASTNETQRAAIQLNIFPNPTSDTVRIETKYTNYTPT